MPIHLVGDRGKYAVMEKDVWTATSVVLPGGARLFPLPKLFKSGPNTWLQTAQNIWFSILIYQPYFKKIYVG